MSTLITAGCSFTEGPNAWPNYTSSELNLNLINSGIFSIGNGLIAKRLIHDVDDYLRSNSSEDLIVGVMWSGIDRHEFRSDVKKLNDHADDDWWSENPTSVVHGIDKWVILNPHWKLNYARIWYKHFHNYIGSIISTLNQIHYVQLYLESHNIRYFMTTFMKIFNKPLGQSLLFRPDVESTYKTHDEIGYLYDMIDFTKFIDITGCYEWIHSNYNLKGLEDPNEFSHPTPYGHKMFAKEVIVPHIKDKLF